jgi:peptidoglycan/xylan/chitin deacetylase (PgdA/CDA1 family)
MLWSYLAWFLGLNALFVAGVALTMPKWFMRMLERRWAMPQHVTFSLDFPPESKRIMLTIDDAPYPAPHWGMGRQSTFDIMRVLEKHGVKAVFFCIGEYVHRDPETTLALANAGHVLANHGYKNRAAIFETYYQTTKSLEKTEALLDKIAPQRRLPSVKLVRPGCGLYGSSFFSAAVHIGYALLLGVNYPHDPFLPLPNWYAWLVLWRLEPNDVIILHDREWTAQTLEILLPEAKRRGYTFVLPPLQI